MNRIDGWMDVLPFTRESGHLTRDGGRMNREQPTTRFLVDAMYFNAACASLQRARAALPNLKKREVQFRLMYEDMADEQPDAEVHLSYMALELHDAYAPVVEECASVHILCAAALEAHINIRAEQKLAPKMWATFERMSLEGKTLILPYLIGVAPFDPGEAPFQPVAQVLKYRNALVHYKPKHEPWELPGVPRVLGKLGLTDAAAYNSVNAVGSLIAELGIRLREGPPSWLRLRGGSVFDIS